MTPLIQESINEILADNPAYPVEDFKWFDIAEVTEKLTNEMTHRIKPEVMKTPLPFEKIGVITKDSLGNRAIIVLSKQHKFSDKYDGTAVLSWVHFYDGDYTARIPPCVYQVEDNLKDGVATVIFDEKTGKPVDKEDLDKKVFSCVMTSLKFVEIFFSSLESRVLSYHEPIKRSNHAKRLRQGKFPLFDWKTVTIQPTKPKTDHQGGTHASPRHHERRGHWRFIKKTQKKVWVRNCKVGDPSNGIVFHDYEITP